jgi:hypothetical protein
LTLRALLTTLRAALGLSPAHVLPMPRWLMQCAATIGEVLPDALLDRETLDMLERGNTADPAATKRLLQCEARPVSAFIAADQADALRNSARLRWLLPLLRGSVALVWIVTGIVSLGIYPVDESYALLARTGVPSSLAPWFLYGAAMLDLLLGLLIFVLHGQRRRWLWRAQAALIAAYSLIIALRLPEFWLHPYGPLLKNIPLLVVLVLLDVMEERDSVRR